MAANEIGIHRTIEPPTAADHQKWAGALRYWLVGRGYHMAARALERALDVHTGLRKDGVTPEWSHQIAGANYLRTMSSGLLDPEGAITTYLLHDIPEDHPRDGDPDKELAEIACDYGQLVAHSVRLLTKMPGESEDETVARFELMAADSRASAGKGADRLHNFQTMVGVFSREKRASYIVEGETLVIPMLKLARRLIPEQEAVYENEKLILRSQIALIRAIEAAGG